MTQRSFEVSKVQAETHQFGRFLACGAFAAAVNWLSRFPLQRVMTFSEAVILAYMIGMAIAFVLFRRYVFPTSSRPLSRQIKFFVLVNIAGIAQVWAVSMALAYYVLPALHFSGALSEAAGHGIAIAVPTISSYFGHRLLTFRRQ